MDDNVQSFYLDSDIIIAYIRGKTDEVYEISKELIGRLRGFRKHKVSIKIPSVVLSEIIHELFFEKNKRLEKEVDKMMHSFLELIDDLEIEYVVPSKEHYELAKKILDKDEFIKPHDALIIAHVLLDKSSKYLFTTDGVLQDSKVIKDLQEEIGVKFKITDFLK